MTQGPPYSRLISLLEYSGPDALNKLKERYPAEGQRVLSSAETLGTEALPEPTDPKKHAVLADLLRVGLVGVRDDLEIVLGQMKSRMKLVNRINFGGALVATVSGILGPAIVYFGAGDKQIALASALVAAVGGLVTITSDYFARSPSGLRLAGGEEYGRTMQMRAEIERMSRVLTRDDAIPVPDAEIGEDLKKLDEYAAQALKLLHA
jgi:hypothetical protein